MKTMLCEVVIVGALETNCCLVVCEKTRECVVVDPGAEPHKIIQEIAQMGVKPVVLINTHGHVDHIGANKEIKEHYDLPLYIHSADQAMLKSSLQSEIALLLNASASPDPDGFLNDGDEIPFGDSRLQVLHTPGHSPGSIVLVGEGFLLSGDSLFYGGVGRTDLPGGSWTELMTSIKEKLFVFPDDTEVFPGHGPHTTVGFEKETNMFLK